MKLKALQAKRFKHNGNSDHLDTLSDGQGLFLVAHPSGAKTWRLRYALNGNRHLVTIGAYFDYSLEEAREEASLLRKQIAKGDNPRRKQTEEITFKPFALTWLEDNEPTWGKEHASKVKRWLEVDAFPVIGDFQLKEIDHGHITEIMQNIEAAGHPTSAAPTLAILTRIFGRALANRVISTNVAQGFPLTEVIRPAPKTKHRAAITKPKLLGELLRDIKAWDAGAYSTMKVLELAPYLFLRPKELQHMRWDYVDFDSALIRLPAALMKKDRDHLVPMASQVTALLHEIQNVTGYSPYVFPNSRNGFKPMSKNVLTNALRKMGYASDVMCGHGFRRTASTMLHEQGWPSAVIETQLAHLVGSETERAYNASQHLPKRAEMMQAWANYLDGLRDGADIIPIRRKA